MSTHPSPRPPARTTPASADAPLRIGELAGRSGVTRDALRYYERLALLPRPSRTAGGFRVYPPAVVDRLRFIRQAQALGLTLAEIREIVTFHGRRGPGRCRRVRDLLSRHVIELDARLAELRELRRTLRSSLAECERALGGPVDAECPVVDSLERPALPARKPHGSGPRFPCRRP